jgi:pyruvate/2-oxoglutarate dehydrogenase complex dihydrolipoamide acyltransferase (E2) component
MAHEVIMPALGMAQETGKIVSWQKQSGDVVKIGDVLMEVETDKAVMDVEAHADGFLGSVSAAAGDDVPVGQVVAVISDGADVAPATAPVDTAEIAETPDGQAIIMPALGMAQETGLIVAWHKAPGDKVGADDVLLEVETDKSTMEVPAGYDGFVAALLAEAGQEVPVGDMIAVVSTAAPETPYQTKAAQRAAAPVTKKAAPSNEKKAPTASLTEAAKPFVADGSRIFASPKTRRLASEQGLDLNRLVAAGHLQPFHAADLNILRSLPYASGNNAPQSTSLPSHITARVPREGTHNFLNWMQSEDNITLSPSLLWAAFAAAALRDAMQFGEKPLVVALMDLHTDTRYLTNPDRARLSELPEGDLEGTADLILRNLSDSPITGMCISGSLQPSLSITTNGEDYRLSLKFSGDQLSDAQAIQLISDFAGRLSEPLRHLL